MSKLSIIIINWNTKDLLRKALSSIKATQGDFCPEVIVVDNGSADGSMEMVKENFPHVSVVQNTKNLGFAKAVNLGLRQAQGEAVLLLNSDAMLLPGALNRLNQVLESDPKIGIAGAELVYEDGTLQNSVDLFPNLLTELFNKSLLKILFPQWYPGKRSGFSQPVEVPNLVGAAMMVRQVAIKQVGLMDEDYFFFMEETDWCYRMKQHGWKNVFVPGAKVCHLQGQTARKSSVRAKVEYYRSRYIFFRKHRSLLSRVVLTVGLFVKVFLGMIFSGLGWLLSAGIWLKGKDRFKQYSYLTLWHLWGCPALMGIASEGDS